MQQLSKSERHFSSLKLPIKIIKYHDVVDYNTLILRDFEWMHIDNLELQLADFQNSIWSQGFVKLRSVVENMDRNRLKNENVYNYEEEILKV